MPRTFHRPARSVRRRITPAAVTFEVSLEWLFIPDGGARVNPCARHWLTAIEDANGQNRAWREQGWILERHELQGVARYAPVRAWTPLFDFHDRFCVFGVPPRDAVVRGQEPRALVTLQRLRSTLQHQVAPEPFGGFPDGPGVQGYRHDPLPE